MSVKIIDAIIAINPNAEVSVGGEDFNNIQWHNGTTPISKADIKAKMAEMPTFEEQEETKKNLRASAKAKLIAGQPLTAEEADTIVL